jgi:succinyl-CoA synthetase beta subunit
VIHAAREQHVKVPIIVRMEGTNVEEGKRLFKESKLKIETADNLQKAAELAVAGAKH